ncbi:MAG: hypothetical protein DRP87_11080 [Spirochaetes bacterium]|nr:MAG: hypothetical protein DRP87_11080 [Spirochaetota bacterium]
MNLKKVVIIALLFGIFTLFGFAQNEEESVESVEEFPPHFMMMFEETLKMAQEDLERIREEINFPELTEEEKVILDAIAEKSREIIEKAKEGLQLIEEKNIEKAIETDHALRLAQMQKEVLFRKRGKLGQLRELRQAAEESGIFDQVEGSIKELAAIHDQIIQIEEKKIDLEKQTWEKVDELYKTIESSRHK